LTASNPVIDIDVTDSRLNTAIRSAVASLIPSVTYRIGKAPKAAVICRTATPFPKIRFALVRDNGAPVTNDNGKPAAVEILGDGQQAVISGMHPDTQRPYSYESAMVRGDGGVEMLASAIDRDGLPEISESWVIEKLFPALTSVLGHYALRLEKSGGGGRAGRTNVDQTALLAPSIEVLRECVTRIPNDLDDRGDYIRFLVAVKAASGAHGEDGFEIASEWAARWTGGVNDPAEVRKEWDSLRAPFAVGYDFLASRARAHGFNDAQLEFAAETEAPTSLLRESDLDRFGKKYALVRTLNNAILYTPQTGKPEVMQVAHWRNLTRNETVAGSDGKRVRLSELWLSSPERRLYGHLVFDPSKEPLTEVPSAHGGKDFNLYPGLAVNPSTEGSCDLFLTHIRDVVANGDEVIYRWVINWLASIVQLPQKLPGTALVLRGSQGAGKSFVGEVLERILGSMHVTISDPGALVGRFNSMHEGKLLIQVEEAFFAGDPRNVGRLKNMITAAKVTIERKGIEAYEVGNYARLFITSNVDWVVPAGLGERRFTVLDVSDKWAHNREYHSALRTQMFEEGGCARLVHYLMHEVVIDEKLISRPVATEALRDQQIASLSADRRWLLDILTDGLIPGDDAGTGTTPTDTLYASYEAALRQRGERRASRESLGKFVKKFGITKTRPRNGSERTWLYVFPPLTEVRDRFARDLAMTPEWGDQNDWVSADAIVGSLL